jgi:hypothetical protein
VIAVRYVIIGCWLIFGLYWVISARSAKSTQETKGRLAGNWHSIWLIIGGLFLSNPPFPAKFGVPLSSLTTLLIPRSIVVQVLIIVLTVTGLIVAIVARRTLAGNWSRAVAFKEDHELITVGLLDLPRHHGHSNIEDRRSSEGGFGCQGQNRNTHQSLRQRPYNWCALRAVPSPRSPRTLGSQAPL